MNKLEQLQQKSTGIIFIKSYPVLNHIKQLTPTDKNLIELVLSYQENKQIFKMKYEKTCSVLNIKMQTLKNTVNKLKDLKILITNHKSNYNGVDGGSSTELSIDMDYLVKLIEETIQYPQSVKEAEIIKTEIVKEKQISEKPIVSNSTKKELMRERFNKDMKYAGDCLIAPSTFHSLTNNYFYGKVKITELLGLKSNDFESFWDRVQELKLKVNNTVLTNE